MRRALCTGERRHGDPSEMDGLNREPAVCACGSKQIRPKVPFSSCFPWPSVPSAGGSIVVVPFPASMLAMDSPFPNMVAGEYKTEDISALRTSRLPSKARCPKRSAALSQQLLDLID